MVALAGTDIRLENRPVEAARLRLHRLAAKRAALIVVSALVFSSSSSTSGWFFTAVRCSVVAGVASVVVVVGVVGGGAGVGDAIENARTDTHKCRCRQTHRQTTNANHSMSRVTPHLHRGCTLLSFPLNQHLLSCAML